MTDETRIERYFGTADKSQCELMLERIHVILRARMILKPERKRRTKETVEVTILGGVKKQMLLSDKEGS